MAGERTPEKIDKDLQFAHPDTGDEITIPAGSVVHRAGDTVNTILGPMVLQADADDGTILYWHNPPETPEGELHPDQVPDYVPRFDRMSVTRRVLGHVTDEEHVGRGPRNTIERLVQELGEDPFTPAYPDFEQVKAHLEHLESEGLVEHRDDGTYGVTEQGLVELRN